MTDGLTVEKVGEEGTMKPEVQNLTLSPGGQPDKYSTTAAMRGSGDHFRGSGPNQAWPHAYLLDANLAMSVKERWEQHQAALNLVLKSLLQ